MITAYQEQIFFHYILTNQQYLGVTKPEFFTSQALREIFEVAKDHAIKYKEPPSKEQMSQLIQMKGLGEKYSDDVIQGLYNTKSLLVEYENEWLENNIGPWIKVRNLDNVMRKAIAYMKTTQSTVENASEVVERVRHMITSETVIDFNFEMGKNFFDATAHLQTRLARSSSGYDYIDLCTKGGYWNGCLIVLFGMPKSGKSMWLCNLAAKSVIAGNNTAYITLELQEEIVNMRIGANLLNVPLDDYEEFTKDQPLLKKKLADLRSRSLQQMGELHVKEFPSSGASSIDIEAYLIKVQDILGYKFKNVFIDYLNIMKNWRNPNSENTYIKIKQISEDVRAMGQKNGWSIISLTQTNRSGWETNDLGVTAIAESAGLLFTVDLLFGIVTNAEMKAAGEYHLKCLANRVAGLENTRKRYTMDWKHARIEEDRNSPIQDMEFFINSTVAGHTTPRGQGNRNTTPTIESVVGSRPQTVAVDPEIKETFKPEDLGELITGLGLF